MVSRSNSPGLFSKVARFVRNPTTDWADLDKAGPESSLSYNKQTLKNMIERKRHDDNIRKREFDHLRKLRRSVSVVTPEMAGKVSIFRGTTNYSDLGERAVTLKKIDEIEAQMSRQWWKGHQHSASGASGLTRPSGTTVPSSFRRSETQPTQNHPSDDGDFVPTQALPDDNGTDNAPTMMGVSPEDARSVLTDPTTAGAPHSVPANPSPNSGFAASRLFATEMGDSLSDPDLEEAAIRFANGDDAGAEAVLLEVLKPGSSASAEATDTWAMALFDLYRCTGQQTGFDQWALDYARRFDKSPPAWFSTPHQIGLQARPAPASTAPQDVKPTVARSNVVTWQCPAHLDAGALGKLQAAQRQSVSVLSLDWSDLLHLSPEAAEILASLFAQWCDQAVSIHCEGVSALMNVLRSATPVGVKQVAPFWWSLRFDAFRLLHLQDDFELSALDYCVTFEVSPPPWRDVRCIRLYQMPQAAAPAADDGGPLFAQGDEWCDTAAMDSAARPASGALPVGRVELTGELKGDASDALISLEAVSRTTQQIVISCRRLIRVDFSAAGSILNWAAHGQALGCHIEFQEVPALVAAFFNLIGINEHARITSRKN